MKMNIAASTNTIIQLELTRLGVYSGEISGIYDSKVQLAFNRMCNLGLHKQSKNFNWLSVYEKDLIKSPVWMKIALEESNSGVKEIKGKLAEERILEYHRSIQLKTSSDEVPWCSSFVNWCLQEVGIKGSRNAAARSWLNWGRMLKTPCFGSIVVLSRGTSSTQGHVGFYVGEKDEYLFLLGGNQNDSVQVSRYNQTRFLASVWPYNLPVETY